MSADSHSQIADTTLFDADKFCQELKATQQPIPVLKSALRDTQEELDKRFKAGVDIRTLIYGRAWVIDVMLAAIWNRFEWPQNNQIELIAVGGYGRGELHPFSDIDFLILFDGTTPESCHDSLSGFLTLLWDIGLDIGSSVRTLEECCEEARNDITIATNLIESRPLVGTGQIHARMYEEVTSEGAWTDKEFFRGKLNEQIERHKKTNDTEYNLEPNLKTSPGGLRDLQTIGWVAKRHFGTTYIRDLVSDGFLTDGELESLNRGELYLWTVRYALHMICGRHEDRLLFDHQRSLAALLGYEDSEKGLAVEQFMSQYYRVVKSMSEFNHMLLQHFDEAILRADEIQVVHTFNNRFHLHNDLLEATSDEIFEKYPCALLEVFVILAQNPQIKGLRASTIRLIRDHRHIIDDQFRNDIRNTSLFMELLKSPERISTELKRMNRLGILGLYLPEFGKIVGQMQHDLFHIYTVDAHTLKLIQITRQFRHRNMQEQF
ncbi:MAG: nucleotidyltransferase domain-containing protein, partial [Pontibacterium sp.]